ncbi:hypothetical protein VTO73DRAFT_540 [Trametes versicolor]
MTSTSNVPFHKLDDTDPSIVYTGEWFDNPGISGVFNNSLSSTIHTGDTAHIEFIASQIVIIGATVAPSGASSDSGPISGYTLDGATNSVFLFQGNAANATGVTFYNSGPISNSKHTLDISIVQINDNIPYLLDAVFLQEEVVTQSATASNTGIWISTVFVTPTAAATSVASNSTASSSASTSSAPVGAIVGGVVGGVALLVAAGLAFYFLYFRHRHRSSYAYRSFGDAPPLFAAEKDDFNGKPSEAQASHQQPFLARAPTSGYADTSPYVPRQAPASEVLSAPITPHAYPPAPASASGSGAGSSTGRTLSVVNNDAAAGAAAFLTPAQRKAEEAQRAKAEADAVQYHADSGVRFDTEGRPIEASASTSEVHPLADVPPEYTPS